MSCAETDSTFPAESRNKAVALLAQDKKTYHVQIFSGVAHGFASRGDLNDPYQRESQNPSVNSSLLQN